MTEIPITTETSLFHRLRPMILILWVVAAARYLHDFRQVDVAIVGQTGPIQWLSDWVSVNYAVVPLLLIFGLAGKFREWSWKRSMLGLLLVAALCWGVPNSIAYTTGQFMGWQHGRYLGQNLAEVDGKVVTFEQDTDPPPGAKNVRTGRNMPVRESILGKLGSGVFIGMATIIAGFIWMFLWFHALVYLPRRFGAKV